MLVKVFRDSNPQNSAITLCELRPAVTKYNNKKLHQQYLNMKQSRNTK